METQHAVHHGLCYVDELPVPRHCEARGVRKIPQTYRLQDLPARAVANCEEAASGVVQARVSEGPTVCKEDVAVGDVYAVGPLKRLCVCVCVCVLGDVCVRV